MLDPGTSGPHLTFGSIGLGIQVRAQRRAAEGRPREGSHGKEKGSYSRRRLRRRVCRQGLARHGADRFDIELINNNNYFVFQPLLPEVAATTILSSDAVAPCGLLFRGVQIRQADMMGIDFVRRR